jgi:phosphatidylinositol-3-phosphatase
VFTIVLENKNYESTFGPPSTAPYLSQTLRAKGQLLTDYYGTGHASLGNYITLISGQSENPTT